MERASSASLRSLITALAVVLGVAAIWAAAALADGSGNSGNSARSDGAAGGPRAERRGAGARRGVALRRGGLLRWGGRRVLRRGGLPVRRARVRRRRPGGRWSPGHARRRSRPAGRRRPVGRSAPGAVAAAAPAARRASLCASRTRGTLDLPCTRRRQRPGGSGRTATTRDDLLVAYFSMEFGIEETLPIYSGGLGVLAGDHLKAAAELGIPLVGVGLLYRGGYFRQGARRAGRQTERLPAGRSRARPVSSASRSPSRSTSPARRSPRRSGARTSARCRSTCSRSTGSPTRSTAATASTGSARSSLLGVGGVRALAALGVEATVFHMNEGHSAFLAHRARCARSSEQRRPDRRGARARCARTTVFTTHTPVPAGNEVFGRGARRALRRRARRAGRPRRRRRCSSSGASATDGGFGLTPLALRLVRARERRLRAARRGRPRACGRRCGRIGTAASAPIGHVTNGVHLGTWLDPALADAPARGAASARRRRRTRPGWDAVGDARPRRALAACTRERRARLAERAGLDPELLTIGFARRFATYKRAGLVFTDVERLLRAARADRRRRQGAPAGRGGQGRDAADRRARARPARAGPRRVPRGLRHRRSRARSSRAATSG